VSCLGGTEIARVAKTASFSIAMTPLEHCLLSQEHWGGELNDYLELHTFIDSTKSWCDDNRHRVLHTHWALDYVILPIFGRTLTNSAGNDIPIKQLVEQDHFFPDYQNRFIPTLTDFITAMDDKVEFELNAKFNEFHGSQASPLMSKVMLSPLAVTGKVKSLLVTHNSWFVNSILPQLLPTEPKVEDFDLSASDVFDRMKLEPWMDEGEDFPPSAWPYQPEKVG